jgi:hypothetical protein
MRDQGWMDPAVAADIRAEISKPVDVTPGLPAVVLSIPPPQASQAPKSGGA